MDPAWIRVSECQPGKVALIKKEFVHRHSQQAALFSGPKSSYFQDPVCLDSGQSINPESPSCCTATVRLKIAILDGREGKDEDRKAEARDEWLRDSRCLLSHVVASITLSNVVFLGTIYRFDAVLMDRKKWVLEWQEVALPEPSALRSQLRGHRRQRRITTAYGLHYFRTGLG
ncbi:hypothetical protein I7I51_04337 [Histoplasma capsulatum]|uniref:Uncharacterized protein n=1 Tax=Ajellomyces capsulatus TaxID=5037 RepID=A0A8A1MA93_AJECA|nr:hypothetical protein I7I51_04337 [Histoplasma capsulatum]